MMARGSGLLLLLFPLAGILSRLMLLVRALALTQLEGLLPRLAVALVPRRLAGMFPRTLAAVVFDRNS